jgi:tRNA nucleotidyltransferase (CCA-adding enzyme)
MSRHSRGARVVNIYRVGGSVRDELLGRAPGDRDWVVVGATPEILVASGYRPVGRDFPVFLHPDTHEEYALARTERKHGQGYRGFEFFASPDVTLEQDLERRDLTINAMARAEDGTLIDPHGGAADLRAGVLRHVSPAFAEDPLRVLRVARFAARFGFVIAPETEALMRMLSTSGELATLAPERVWQELATGLMERFPSRMLSALRECGALAQLLPEVDALYGVPQRVRDHPEIDTGVRLARALDYGAEKGFALPVRYGVLAHDLGKGATPRRSWPGHAGHESRSARLAERMSARLKVPLDCRDAGRLAARWHGIVHAAREQSAAALLDLLTAADALRRPERLDTLLEACECDAHSLPGRGGDYVPGQFVRAALSTVKGVDAAAVARKARSRTTAGSVKATNAIAKAVRAARLKALRAWRSTTIDTRPLASRPRRRASGA